MKYVVVSVHEENLNNNAVIILPFVTAVISFY